MLTFLSPIHKASRQIGLYFEERMAAFEVGPGEGHLLSYLVPYGPSPIAELIRVFGQKQSTMTSMLDRLEALSLVERQVNPNDRRSFVIHVTEKGREVAARLQVIVDELEQAIEGRVKPADIEGFRAVMAAVGAVSGVDVRSGSRDAT